MRLSQKSLDPRGKGLHEAFQKLLIANLGISRLSATVAAQGKA